MIGWACNDPNDEVCSTPSIQFIAGYVETVRQLPLAETVKMR
jgi:hypothetical protein